MGFLGFKFGKGKTTSKGQKMLGTTTPAISPSASFTVIQEPYTGAWQRNDETTVGSLTCYPTLYACLSRISQDMGKLPFQLRRNDENGIGYSVERLPIYSVLRKPNNYQTAQQFREAWSLSKLMHGNAYILKGRDNRGHVERLYVLDPGRVMPMVTPSGDVYYRLQYSVEENLLPQDYPAEKLIVPAKEIIHDRWNTFHHQLIGIPPLCAAQLPATKNQKILNNASTFFGNHAQPGGILTAPAGIKDEQAEEIKKFWNSNYSGKNRGKIAVIGADMKFQAFSTNSADSQLVEQMQYSDKQIVQPFGIPMFVAGVGDIPAGMKIDDVMNTYYTLGLQSHIEAMETLLTEGLELNSDRYVRLNIEPILRMDLAKRAEVWGGLRKDGIASPDEARYQFNLKPLAGGDTVYMQQQDIPLEEARRNTAGENEEERPERLDPSEQDQARSMQQTMALTEKKVFG